MLILYVHGILVCWGTQEGRELFSIEKPKLLEVTLSGNEASGFPVRRESRRVSEEALKCVSADIHITPTDSPLDRRSHRILGNHMEVEKHGRAHAY